MMDGLKGYFSSALELHKQTGKHTEVAKTGEVSKTSGCFPVCL